MRKFFPLLFVTFTVLVILPMRTQASAIPSDKVLIYLIQMEGFKLVPYRDGHQLCVGIGHVITDSTVRIYSDEQIYAWFDADLANARRICRKGIKGFDDLPHDAQLVSISLAWCVGPTGFMRWKDFRTQLSKRRYKRAAEALQQSLWWKQVSVDRAEDAYNRLYTLW